eukprot:6145482-Prymnesium_polylepis.1
MAGAQRGHARHLLDVLRHRARHATPLPARAAAAHPERHPLPRDRPRHTAGRASDAAAAAEGEPHPRAVAVPTAADGLPTRRAPVAGAQRV